MSTSNEWKVVDKPLEAVLTLFIVIILLYKKKPYKHTRYNFTCYLCSYDKCV